MSAKFTINEQKLVNYCKKAVVKYNKMRHENGGIDTLYSFLTSDSGAIHDGACLETNLSHAVICGERLAIANMVMKESYKAKIQSIVVANAAPKVQKHGTVPCGTCRHLIWEFGKPATTVIVIQYIQGKHGWTFPKMEKYKIKDLYPHPYEPVEGLWDNYAPLYEVEVSEKKK